MYLLGLASNKKLDSVVGELRNLVLAHGQTTVPYARSSQELAGDREELMAAILAEDAPAAAAAVRGHITRTAQMLIRSICSRTETLVAQPFLDRLDDLIS